MWKAHLRSQPTRGHTAIVFFPQFFFLQSVQIPPRLRRAELGQIRARFLEGSTPPPRGPRISSPRHRSPSHPEGGGRGGGARFSTRYFRFHWDDRQYFSAAAKNTLFCVSLSRGIVVMPGRSGWSLKSTVPLKFLSLLVLPM